MAKRFSKNDRDNYQATVNELCCKVETMDEDEWDTEYEALPEEYQAQVDEFLDDFAHDW